MLRKNLPDSRVVDTHRKSPVDRGPFLTRGKDDPSRVKSVGVRRASLVLFAKIRVAQVESYSSRRRSKYPCLIRKPGCGLARFVFACSPDLTHRLFDPVRVIGSTDGSYRSADDRRQRHETIVSRYFASCPRFRPAPWVFSRTTSEQR